MKKLLGVLLAIAMTWPAGASILNNVEVKGEIQTIASDVRSGIEKYNTGMGTLREKSIYNRGAWTRAMAGLSADLVEDVTANILFQYAYKWGENNEGNLGFSNGNGVKMVNANVVLSNLFGALETTIGRQFYGDENSAVMYFGPNHYNAERGMYASALDAVKLVYRNETIVATVLAGKIANLASLDWDFEDTDPSSIFGADVKLNLTENLIAQVYGYGWRNVGNWSDYYNKFLEDAYAGLYGAKLTFAPETFLLSAEYARNHAGSRLIKEHKRAGYMLKVDGAVKATDALTVRGTFHYETLDSLNFGNYTPGLLIGHYLRERLNEYSSDGLRLFNIGVDYKPAERWTVSLDGYSFQDRFGRHSATYETDVTAKYDHNEYVQLFAGLGYAKYSQSEENYWFYGKENFKGQLGMLIKF